MEKEKISIYHMSYHQQGSTETHFILRVPGGWIYTDRRGNSAVGTFVAWRNMDYIEDSKGNKTYEDILIDKM